MEQKHKETKVTLELALVIACKLLFIFCLIACKLLFIFCLWYFFFSPEHRTEVTPEVISDAFFSDTQTTSVSP